MTINYTPRGVCSRMITFDLEDNIVKNVKFTGGCNGNLQGIAKLVEGLPAEDVIKKLENCNNNIYNIYY